MPFNVNTFVTELNKNGVLKTSKFDVVIYGPTAILGARQSPSEFRCVAASIPGININTLDFKLYGGMPNLKVPKSREYDTLRLTFLAQSDFSDRYYFEDWFNLVSNLSSNNIGYYDDVTADIHIQVYDETKPNDIPYEIVALNAIAINIDSVDLSWAETDALIEYNVTFSYEQLQFNTNLDLQSVIMQ